MARAKRAIVQFNARIPADLHQRVKLHAVRTETPMDKLVQQALRDLLRRARKE